MLTNNVEHSPTSYVLKLISCYRLNRLLASLDHPVRINDAYRMLGIYYCSHRGWKQEHKQKKESRKQAVSL